MNWTYKTSDIIESCWNKDNTRRYDIIPASFARAYGSDKVMVMVAEKRLICFTTITAWSNVDAHTFDNIILAREWITQQTAQEAAE
jgi:hypothetical protein